MIQEGRALRLTFRHLSYFVSAAQHESVIRAAEVLNVSPPTISAAIAFLEETLGVQLFIRRHARGMVLTEDGRYLMAAARDIISQVQDLERLRDSNRSPAHNTLYLGCLGDIAPYVVPPVVRRFRNTHPQVNVRIGDHAGLTGQLSEGSLDVAIFLDFEASPLLQATSLRPTPPQCIVPSQHRLAAAPVISLEDLAGEDFILLDMPRTRDYFLSIFNERNLRPNIAHLAASAEMVRSLVANGFGYSILNFWPPRPLGDGGDVVYRPIRGVLRPSHLVAVHLYRHRPADRRHPADRRRSSGKLIFRRTHLTLPQRTTNRYRAKRYEPADWG